MSEINVDNAAQLANDWVAKKLPKYPYPEGQFEGRGVVIPAGGKRLATNAWVCLNMLRRMGCELPVEVWYLGRRERDPLWEELVAPLDAVCIDAHAIRDANPDSWPHSHRRLHGWELKPYAITHSRFREVLLLDADNVPVADPTFLFDTPQFAKYGAIFWPDFGRLAPTRQCWKLFGDIPYRDEPEFESGQIVLDKARHWDCLMLCHWYMQHSNDFWFRHVHGDKEIFHLAWRKLQRPYAMPERGIDALPGVMCQHDFEGRRIFQHRNLRKWQLDRQRNRRTKGFLYEEACLRYLDQLREAWGFMPRKLRALQPEDQAAMRGVVGHWTYERVGHDRRQIELCEDGTIGAGRERCEAYWWIEGGFLRIADEDCNLTCKLKPAADGGIWRGRWERHERMPVELTPVADGRRAA